MQPYVIVRPNKWRCAGCEGWLWRPRQVAHKRCERTLRLHRNPFIVLREVPEDLVI